jgi:hypothetical protein
MSKGLCQRIEGCRSCGHTGLRTVLELGELPLANALLDGPGAIGAERRFPLTLAFCPSCSLVQILETVDRAAETFIARRGLGAGSMVVELASNDGYLLKNFVARGIGVLGIEPARNIAEAANKAGVPTRAVFFGAQTARDLRAEGLRADVVLGNNVLAHVADLNGFVGGAASILKRRAEGASRCGCVAFEVPYLGEMVAHLEFDTIYHEHLCYYSLTALQGLFARHGLAVVDVERLPVHGGSIRVWGEPADEAQAPSEAVGRLLAHERAGGMTGAAHYDSFARDVKKLCDDLRREVEQRVARGQRVAAYGASAKGSTLMNFAGIGAQHLRFVADLSTAKQGRLTPGNHLPIVAPGALTDPATRPDAAVLLSWNWAAEIARQQRAYLEGGGVFIVPVPALRLITKDDLPGLLAAGAGTALHQPGAAVQGARA